MKRIQERFSLLTVLWTAVGIILLSVFLALAGSRHVSQRIAAFGAIVFVVAGAMFASEVHLAISTVNFRVDDRVRHGTSQDMRLAAIERQVGLAPPAPDIFPTEVPR